MLKTVLAAGAIAAATIATPASAAILIEGQGWGTGSQRSCDHLSGTCTGFEGAARVSFRFIVPDDTFAPDSPFRNGDTWGVFGGSDTRGWLSITLDPASPLTNLRFGSGALTAVTERRGVVMGHYSGTVSARITPGVSGTGSIFEFSVVAIPEPASWATMIAGFGLLGGALRRRPGHATS